RTPKPPAKSRLVGLTAVVALLVVGLGLGALRLFGPSKSAAPAPEQASANAAPAASAPALVSIQLTLDPSNAIVEIDGAKVKESTIRLPKDDRVHKLVVRADGYETESREVSAQADTILTLSLKPQKESAKAVSQSPPVQPPANPRPGRPSAAPTSTPTS